MSAEWPEIGGTLKEARPAARVRAGAALALSVRLDLPAGWHLTEGAPSALRVEGLGAALTQPVASAETAVSIGPVPAGGATLRVRLLYYVCQDQGTCRIRSADLSVPLTPAADAAAALEIVDTFAP